MRYEEMSAGKKVCYTIVAWLLLLVTLGGVWYLNSDIPFCNKPDFTLTIFRYEFVSDIVNTVMLLLTAILIVGISETMTRLKRHASERVMCIALVMGLLISLDSDFAYSKFFEPGVYGCVYGMVAALIFMWAYLRELPYECFGSKEPWFLVTLWIIPVGLLAGFSGVNLGLMLFIFAIAATCYVSKVDHRVFAWMPIGAVSVLLGTVARVLLPAFPDMDFDKVIKEYGSVSELYLYGVGLLQRFFAYLLPAILVTLAVVALLKGVHNVVLGREVVYVLSAAAATLLFTVFVPRNEGLTTHQVIVLLILACAAMCLKMFEKKPAMKTYIYIGCGFLWLRAAYVILTALFI